MGLSGRGGGSGKYETWHASKGRRSVEVQHLPEDFASVRILFKEFDATTSIIVDEVHAECLWAALDRMAKQRGWTDELELMSAQESDNG